MSGTPFMPLWVADFVGDTLDLGAKEIGAYMLILMAMWGRDGYLPNDAKKLQRVARCGRDWPDVWSSIQHYLVVDGDRITQGRLLKELQKVVSKREVNAQSGARGGTAKALKYKEAALASATVSPKQLAPEPLERREAKASLRETQSRFDEFWDTYPHRGGAKKGRKASQAKYEAAIKRGVPEQDIIAGAERYGGDRGVIDGYAKDPATWLNGAGWQDDIETKGPIVQTQGGRNDGNSKGEQRMRAFLEGARGSSGMDRGPDIDPSRPLLARG